LGKVFLPLARESATARIVFTALPKAIIDFKTLGLGFYGERFLLKSF